MVYNIIMKKGIKLSSFLILVFIFALPIFVLAQQGEGATRDRPAQGEGRTPAQTQQQGGSITQRIKIENPFKTNTIEGLIRLVIDSILLPIGAVVATVMIIYSGFLFVTAQGDPAKLTKAKESLLYAVIGSAILLGAYLISETIGGTIEELRR